MRFAAVLLVVGCASARGPITFTPEWPTHTRDYIDVTEAWTRNTTLRGQYQEVLDLSATIKSPEWRAAHAAREAEYRGLTGGARDQLFAQAKAEMAGPYEIELLVTTWDRHEDDLDKGKRSVWHISLVDDAGHEIVPYEIVKDKRPRFTLRAEFPEFGDFATAYIARFSPGRRATPPAATPPAPTPPADGTVPNPEPAMFGPNVHTLRLHMSSERGGVELVWNGT